MSKAVRLAAGRPALAVWALAASLLALLLLAGSGLMLLEPWAAQLLTRGAGAVSSTASVPDDDDDDDDGSAVFLQSLRASGAAGRALWRQHLDLSVPSPPEPAADEEEPVAAAQQAWQQQPQQPQQQQQQQSCPQPLPLPFSLERDWSRGWASDLYDESWRRTMAGEVVRLKVWQHGGQQVKWLATFGDGRQALIKPVSIWKENMTYEVASHHVDRLLGLYRAPYVAFRPIARDLLLQAIVPGKHYSGYREHYEVVHGKDFKDKASKDMSTFVDAATGQTMVVAEWMAIMPRDRIDAKWGYKTDGEVVDMFTFDILVHNLRTGRNTFGYEGLTIYLDNHGALARKTTPPGRPALFKENMCRVTTTMKAKLHHVLTTQAANAQCQLGAQFLRRVIAQNPFPIPDAVLWPLQRYSNELNTYVQQWFQHMTQCKQSNPANTELATTVPNNEDNFTSAKRKRWLGAFKARMQAAQHVMLQMCNERDVCEAGDRGMALMMTHFAPSRAVTFFDGSDSTAAAGGGGDGVLRPGPLSAADLASLGCTVGPDGRAAQACLHAKHKVFVVHLKDNALSGPGPNVVVHTWPQLMSYFPRDGKNAHLYTVLRSPVHRAVREWKRVFPTPAERAEHSLAAYCALPSVSTMYIRQLSRDASLPSVTEAADVIRSERFTVLVPEFMAESVALLAYQLGISIDELLAAQQVTDRRRPGQAATSLLAALKADEQWLSTQAEMLQCQSGDNAQRFAVDVTLYDIASQQLFQRLEDAGPEIFRDIERLRREGGLADSSQTSTQSALMNALSETADPDRLNSGGGSAGSAGRR